MYIVLTLIGLYVCLSLALAMIIFFTSTSKVMQDFKSNTVDMFHQMGKSDAILLFEGFPAEGTLWRLILAALVFTHWPFILRFNTIRKEENNE